MTKRWVMYSKIQARNNQGQYYEKNFNYQW